MSSTSPTFRVVIAAAWASSGALYSAVFPEGPLPLGVITGAFLSVLAISYERGAISLGSTGDILRCPPDRTMVL